MSAAALMYKACKFKPHAHRRRLHLSRLVNQRQGEVNETDRMQLDTLSSNIWFVWQEDCIKEWRSQSQAGDFLSTGILDADFAQAISSNQGLIELTQKEKDGFGNVVL